MGRARALGPWGRGGLKGRLIICAFFLASSFLGFFFIVIPGSRFVPMDFDGQDRDIDVKFATDCIGLKP